MCLKDSLYSTRRENHLCISNKATKEYRLQARTFRSDAIHCFFAKIQSSDSLHSFLYNRLILGWLHQERAAFLCVNKNIQKPFCNHSQHQHKNARFCFDLSASPGQTYGRKSKIYTALIVFRPDLHFQPKVSRCLL